MPVHDAYARVTPFELLLPEAGFADQRFPLIRAEAEERKVELSDPDRFVMLSEAGAILRTIRAEGDDPRLIGQFGLLLFHAFHFWQMGQPLFLLETGVVRYLVDTGPEEGTWSATLPRRAGYLQFPQHLIWVPGGDRDGDPPESLDGFFWSAPDGENLSLLIVMGIRKDRPGLSVVPLPSLPVAAAGEWASMKVRPRGKDFSSSLPGAELEHLYSVEAGAEAVKLALRVFWYLDTSPACVADCEPGPAEGDGPRPSVLVSRRILMGEG